MNIFHIIDSAGMYGAEAVLLNLMEAQRGMGLSPFLLSLGNMHAGTKDIEIAATNRKLHVSTLRFRDGLNIAGTFELLNIARRKEAHIIHSHGYKGNILLGLLPRRLRNIPTITTIHGWTATRLLSKIYIYEFFDALAMKNLDTVVGVSESIFSKRRIKCLGLKPTIINNGIKTLAFEKGAFSREYPAIASKCSEYFQILAIGRLSPEKGFDILLTAIASLVSDNIPVSMAIIGEGELRAHLTNLISKLALGDRVHMLGYRQDAHRYLHDFDAFVLPSLTEGLPITILEAMQAEIPIVATRVGEIPNLLDDGELGVLVTPNDPADLSNGLKRVYNDRNMAKERARKARQKVLDKYGIEQMAMKYDILYQNIIDKCA